MNNVELMRKLIDQCEKESIENKNSKYSYSDFKLLVESFDTDTFRSNIPPK